MNQTIKQQIGLVLLIGAAAAFVAFVPA